MQCLFFIFIFIEDTESLLKCSTCPESFKNAINLLKHAQFIHNLEIYKDKENQEAFRNRKFSSGSHPPPQKQTNDAGNNECNSNATTTTKTTTISSNKDEIFIDVISSNAERNFSNRNQSYNITVKSSPAKNGSFPLGRKSHSKHLDEARLQEREQNASGTSLGQDFLGQSENSMASCSATSSSVDYGKNDESTQSVKSMYRNFLFYFLNCSTL